MNAPTVNVNGTELRGLLRQKLDVLKAYEALLNALILAAPHPRDYPGGEAEYAVARAAHRAEMDRVADKKEQAWQAVSAVIT